MFQFPYKDSIVYFIKRFREIQVYYIYITAILTFTFGADESVCYIEKKQKGFG